MLRRSLNNNNSFYENKESNNNNKTFFLNATNATEIMSIINKLKTKVTPGYDKISNEVIRNIGSYISDPLTYIFNLSIEKAEYPKSFKLVVVIPIHKAGSKVNCSNCRPISLTSNLSKIFEMLLKKRIIEFLDKYNIIAKRQYGFRDEYSTSDAINYLTKTL